MPQDINGNKALLDPSQDAPGKAFQAVMPSQSFRVDSFADRLMDDLFDDVERLLDGSLPPPPLKRIETAKRQPMDVNPTPQFSDLVPQPHLPQWNTLIREDSLAVPEVHELMNGKPQVLRLSSVFQKLLVVALFASAIAAASLWLTQRGMVGRLVRAIAQEPQVVAPVAIAKAPPVEHNQQFSEYVQRSLAAIDRKAASGKPMNGATVPYKNSLPTAAGSGATSSTPLPKVPVVINVPPIAAAPPTAPAAVMVNDPARQELNQLLARLSGVLERMYPANRPQIQQAMASATKAVPSTPELQRTIRGLVIATDPTQSAALVETNGVTQRYYTGETVGSSGWSIVEIAGSSAVLRRNGELRTLSTGQKF
ncbi:type II secretion system protein N [Myxacorys almedinensis]|uniref:Type II secretion system protein GspC N-terminal domain-containing protein n=1 Tax=Myxacorys almedinensis A TaxID=2690445 RepID=A0A8J8CMK7_9CYAN|nr:type II secretion system protein N [Myxacorys almedinensis]NDJ17387.1 hypothetical protein [Myxacorys almedinensis A]